LSPTLPESDVNIPAGESEIPEICDTLLMKDKFGGEEEIADKIGHKYKQDIVDEVPPERSHREETSMQEMEEFGGTGAEGKSGLQVTFVSKDEIIEVSPAKTERGEEEVDDTTAKAVIVEKVLLHEIQEKGSHIEQEEGTVVEVEDGEKPKKQTATEGKDADEEAVGEETVVSQPSVTEVPHTELIFREVSHDVISAFEDEIYALKFPAESILPPRMESVEFPINVTDALPIEGEITQETEIIKLSTKLESTDIPVNETSFFLEDDIVAKIDTCQRISTKDVKGKYIYDMGTVIVYSDQLSPTVPESDVKIPAGESEKPVIFDALLMSDKFGEEEIADRIGHKYKQDMLDEEPRERSHREERRIHKMEDFGDTRAEIKSGLEVTFVSKDEIIDSSPAKTGRGDEEVEDTTAKAVSVEKVLLDEMQEEGSHMEQEEVTVADSEDGNTPKKQTATDGKDAGEKFAVQATVESQPCVTEVPRADLRWREVSEDVVSESEDEMYARKIPAEAILPPLPESVEFPIIHKEALPTEGEITQETEIIKLSTKFESPYTPVNETASVLQLNFHMHQSERKTFVGGKAKGDEFISESECLLSPSRNDDVKIKACLEEVFVSLSVEGGKLLTDDSAMQDAIKDISLEEPMLEKTVVPVDGVSNSLKSHMNGSFSDVQTDEKPLVLPEAREFNFREGELESDKEVCRVVSREEMTDTDTYKFANGSSHEEDERIPIDSAMREGDAKERDVMKFVYEMRPTLLEKIGMKAQQAVPFQTDRKVTTAIGEENVSEKFEVETVGGEKKNEPLRKSLIYGTAVELSDELLTPRDDDTNVIENVLLSSEEFIRRQRREGKLPVEITAEESNRILLEGGAHPNVIHMAQLNTANEPERVAGDVLDKYGKTEVSSESGNEVEELSFEMEEEEVEHQSKDRGGHISSSACLVTNGRLKEKSAVGKEVSKITVPEMERFLAEGEQCEDSVISSVAMVYHIETEKCAEQEESSGSFICTEQAVEEEESNAFNACIPDDDVIKIKEQDIGAEGPPFEIEVRSEPADKETTPLDLHAHKTQSTVLNQGEFRVEISETFVMETKAEVQGYTLHRVVHEDHVDNIVKEMGDGFKVDLLPQETEQRLSVEGDFAKDEASVTQSAVDVPQINNNTRSIAGDKLAEEAVLVSSKETRLWLEDEEERQEDSQKVEEVEPLVVQIETETKSPIEFAAEELRGPEEVDELRCKETFVDGDETSSLKCDMISHDRELKKQVCETIEGEARVTVEPDIEMKHVFLSEPKVDTEKAFAVQERLCHIAASEEDILKAVAVDYDVLEKSVVEDESVLRRMQTEIVASHAQAKENEFVMDENKTIQHDECRDVLISEEISTKNKGPQVSTDVGVGITDEGDRRIQRERSEAEGESVKRDLIEMTTNIENSELSPTFLQRKEVKADISRRSEIDEEASEAVTSSIRSEREVDDAVIDDAEQKDKFVSKPEVKKTATELNDVVINVIVEGLSRVTPESIEVYVEDDLRTNYKLDDRVSESVDHLEGGVEIRADAKEKPLSAAEIKEKAKEDDNGLDAYPFDVSERVALTEVAEDELSSIESSASHADCKPKLTDIVGDEKSVEEGVFFASQDIIGSLSKEIVIFHSGGEEGVKKSCIEVDEPPTEQDADPGPREVSVEEKSSEVVVRDQKKVENIADEKEIISEELERREEIQHLLDITSTEIGGMLPLPPTPLAEYEDGMEELQVTGIRGKEMIADMNGKTEVTETVVGFIALADKSEELEEKCHTSESTDKMHEGSECEAPVHTVTVARSECFYPPIKDFELGSEKAKIVTTVNIEEMSPTKYISAIDEQELSEEITELTAKETQSEDRNVKEIDDKISPFLTESTETRTANVAGTESPMLDKPIIIGQYFVETGSSEYFETQTIPATTNTAAKGDATELAETKRRELEQEGHPITTLPENNTSRDWENEISKEDSFDRVTMEGCEILRDNFIEIPTKDEPKKEVSGEDAASRIAAGDKLPNQIEPTSEECSEDSFVEKAVSPNETSTNFGVIDGSAKKVVEENTEVIGTVAKGLDREILILSTTLEGRECVEDEREIVVEGVPEIMDSKEDSVDETDIKISDIDADTNEDMDLATINLAGEELMEDRDTTRRKDPEVASTENDKMLFPLALSDTAKEVLAVNVKATDIQEDSMVESLLVQTSMGEEVGIEDLIATNDNNIETMERTHMESTYSPLRTEAADLPEKEIIALESQEDMLKAYDVARKDSQSTEEYKLPETGFALLEEPHVVESKATSVVTTKPFSTEENAAFALEQTAVDDHECAVIGHDVTTRVYSSVASRDDVESKEIDIEVGKQDENRTVCTEISSLQKEEEEARGEIGVQEMSVMENGLLVAQSILQGIKPETVILVADTPHVQKSHPLMEEKVKDLGEEDVSDEDDVPDILLSAEESVGGKEHGLVGVKIREDQIIATVEKGVGEGERILEAYGVRIRSSVDASTVEFGAVEMSSASYHVDKMVHVERSEHSEIRDVYVAADVVPQMQISGKCEAVERNAEEKDKFIAKAHLKEQTRGTRERVASDGIMQLKCEECELEGEISAEMGTVAEDSKTEQPRQIRGSKLKLVQEVCGAEVVKCRRKESKIDVCDVEPSSPSVHEEPLKMESKVVVIENVRAVSCKEGEEEEEDSNFVEKVVDEICECPVEQRTELSCPKDEHASTLKRKTLDTAVMTALPLETHAVDLAEISGVAMEPPVKDSGVFMHTEPPVKPESDRNDTEDENIADIGIAKFPTKECAVEIHTDALGTEVFVNETTNIRAPRQLTDTEKLIMGENKTGKVEVFESVVSKEDSFEYDRPGNIRKCSDSYEVLEEKQKQNVMQTTEVTATTMELLNEIIEAECGMFPPASTILREGMLKSENNILGIEIDVEEKSHEKLLTEESHASNEEKFGGAENEDNVVQTTSLLDDTPCFLLPSDTMFVPLLSFSDISQIRGTRNASEEIGHGTNTSRQEQLHIETRVTETEVKELMCEVREVTRQIKQEVRELKPDLTPTPEGRESSILPLSESREFVELADLGCIKEEQPILGFDEKRSESAILSYATLDTGEDTASRDQDVKVNYGSFPPSEVAEFKAKGDTEACEETDIFTRFSDVGIMRRLSPAAYIQHKLSSHEYLVPGGDIVDVDETITEQSTLGTPGHDRKSECEEQLGALLDTCINLPGIASGEADIQKEVLDKPSVSQIETLTHSTLGLGVIPSAVTGASASDQMFETSSEPESETKAELLENDFDPVFPIHSPLRRIKDDSYIKKALDVCPEEDGNALPDNALRKLPIESGMDIDIPDEHCLSEHSVNKLHTKEDGDKLQFAPSSMIVKEERACLIHKMKLKFKEPQCDTDVHESLLPTDVHNIHDSQPHRKSEKYTDPSSEDVPERELQDECVDSGRNAESRHSGDFDTASNVLQSPLSISTLSSFEDAAVVKTDVQDSDSETKRSEFVTAHETPLALAALVGAEKPLITESHCVPELFVSRTRELSAEEIHFSALAKDESSDNDLSTETEPAVPKGTAMSRTARDLTSHAPLQDRHFLANAEPVCATKDVTALIQESFVEVPVATVSPDVFATPTFLSEMKSGVLSQGQSLVMVTEKVTDFPAESPDWRVESDNAFGISADDIIMKDDLLEVTVSADKAGYVFNDGKLFRTTSDAAHVERETGVRPSVVRRGGKVTEDTPQGESSTRKGYFKGKTKELSERQAQKEPSIKKVTRAPVAPSATKRADDHMIVMQHTKDQEKSSRVAEVSSSGAVSRYRGYMASTLSRDLKVERSVADRSSYFKRESSMRRRVNTESEDSSTSASPSKPQILKHTATGTVPRTSDTVMKSSDINIISVANEKHVQEAVTKKHVGISKRTKPTTSVVTTRSAADREDKLVPSRPTSTGNITGHQKYAACSDSSAYFATQTRLHSAAEDAASQDRSRRRKRGVQTKLTDSKAMNVKKEHAEAVTVSAVAESFSEHIPKSICGAELENIAIELESRSRLDDRAVLRAVEYSTEPTEADGTVAEPVPSSTQYPTSVERHVSISHPHKTDFKDIAIARTACPPSAAPTPESSPSIKSILDKSSAFAVERRNSRPPSRSPSASPVRAATSASRYTERFDYTNNTPPSLPSSPSRMARQMTSQVGVTQLLTSEVFTRTVDASGSIEVIYRQPTSSEALRRVAVVPGTRSSLHDTIPGVCNVSAEGDISLIDTTDSSLSDSVALPSSSSDHDLSVDTRLRTGGSPASPKPTRRSLDLIHDGLGPKLRSSDMLVDYCPVPSAAGSEHLGQDSSVPRLESSSSVAPLDAAPKARTCTSVSEERLSPILDVRAVTPPRVKHKFQYEGDNEDGEREEEEPIPVFHSSPGKINFPSTVPTFHPTMAAST
jgi:hypothetical protein